jgi:hypothetical protein
MTGDAWFRPKRYGYGATPVNWKGWLFLAVMIAAFAGLGVLKPISSPLAWALGLATWFVILMVVGVWKTEGQWGWRWGARNKNRGT